MLPALAGLLWLLPCAWTDARTGRLPHPLTHIGLAGALALRLILIAAGHGDAVPLLAGLLVGAVSLHLHRRGRMGGGDVPVLTGLALLSPPLLAGASLAVLAWQIGQRLRPGTAAGPLPMAPPLLVGWAATAGIMCGQPLAPGFCAG